MQFVEGATESHKPLSTSYNSSSPLAWEALAHPKSDLLIAGFFAVASSVLKRELARLLTNIQNYQWSGSQLWYTWQDQRNTPSQISQARDTS